MCPACVLNSVNLIITAQELCIVLCHCGVFILILYQLSLALVLYFFLQHDFLICH